jgi:acetyltransferase-like isoleucine patch superfamily enzyme
MFIPPFHTLFSKKFTRNKRVKALRFHKVIKSFVKRVVNDPYRTARDDSRIQISPTTILLDSTRFQMRPKGGLVTIGADAMVGCNFIFESEQGEISVGARTYIGPSTNLISRTKISIGDDVTIAWGCYVYDHDSHSLDWRERAKDIAQQNESFRKGEDFITSKDWTVVKSKPVVIANKVWLGFDVAILKGVTIGEGAVVAAKSVVTKDVAPWTVVAGNPAIEVKKLQAQSD